MLKMFKTARRPRRGSNGARSFNYIYIVSAALFILSLKWMNSPATARRGVFAGEAGMLLAIVGTLLRITIVNWEWILAAFLIGAAVGVPHRVYHADDGGAAADRLSHACGALAAALVGTAEYYQRQPSCTNLHGFIMVALIVEMLLGFLTFTGSLMAVGKLQEVLPQRPITYRNQNVINLAAVRHRAGARHPADSGARPTPGSSRSSPVSALLFGVLLIMPIGGADMPTVIALLNSYAGLSACAMGFALDNKLLVIAGALDGSSGLILSIIMCKAMNRSFTNVLFGAFGQVQAAAGAERAAACAQRRAPKKPRRFWKPRAA